MNLDELGAVLRRFDIDLGLWGKDGKGTVEQLLSEINHGGGELIGRSEGLILSSATVAVRISHFVRDLRRELVWKYPDLDHVCLYQRLYSIKGMRAGILRRFVLGQSGCHAGMVARRAIRDEIGLSEGEPIDFYYEHPPLSLDLEPSRRYPGILSDVTVQAIEWDMPAKHYRAEGYQALLWLEEPREASE